jgi:hypothetical protein
MNTTSGRRFLFLLAVVVGLSLPGILQAQGVRGGADSVRVRLDGVETLEAVSDARGSMRTEVRVALVHARDFHSWPDEPVVPPELKGLNPIATSIQILSAPEGVELVSIDWPEPVMVTVRYAAEPLELLSFVDTTVARLSLKLPGGSDEPGAALDPEARLELQVQFQSCDEEYCYPPRRETLSVPLDPLP